MKYIIKISLFLSLLFCFTSCDEGFFEQVIDIDPPEFEAKMVVDARFSQGETKVDLVVRRNIGILENPDNQKDFVAGATIEILKDDERFAEFNAVGLSDPYYFAELPESFEAGKTYTLRLSHDSLPTMSASQTLPTMVEVDSIRYRQNAGIDSYGDDLGEIAISFKDPANEANYYAMRVEKKYVYYYDVYDNMGNIIGQDSSVSIETMYLERSDDPNVERGIGDYALIQDNFFDGEDYRFTFKFYDWTGGDTENQFTVTFESITEEVYLNLKARQRYADTADSPFAEPTAIYTNFDNGIGIFGLSSRQVFEIE